jgi:hypothetical protein
MSLVVKAAGRMLPLQQSAVTLQVRTADAISDIFL